MKKIVIFVGIILIAVFGILFFKNIRIGDKLVNNIEIAGVKDIEVEVGSDIDLLSSVSALDGNGKNINLRIDGNYDLNTPGSYNLKYVTDDNKVSKDFVLVVKEKENDIEVINGATYINGILIINKSYSVSSDYVPENLVSYNGIQMESNALEAFKNLVIGAKNDGYNITPRTAYRSYSFQESIYNGYLKNDTRENVDTYSARPGSSEHHSGLSVDVNSLEQSWGDTLEGLWLKDNAYKYGFIIRYPKGKEDITGYMYEPWHIRYVGDDIAKKLYNDGDYITLEEYLNIDSVYSD